LLSLAGVWLLQRKRWLGMIPINEVRDLWYRAVSAAMILYHNSRKGENGHSCWRVRVVDSEQRVLPFVRCPRAVSAHSFAPCWQERWIVVYSGRGWLLV